MISSGCLTGLFVSLAALTIGCQGNGDLSRASLTQLTSAPVAVPVQAAPVQDVPIAAPPPAPIAAPTPMFAAPVGEQVLDTSVTPPPSAAPILATKNLKLQKVRTVSDERLPKWVPVKGRLTVVDSAALAENLGLVPKGTTKTSDERISVADKLAEQNAARAATGDPMTRGVSWNLSNGRVKNHR